MSALLDEHRRYLADDPRIRAFRQAIFAVVQPGDVVVDLGAGTGILGLLAAQAGAGRVYCIERSGLIHLTREIVAASGLAERFVFLRQASTSVELPEKVDVVIADQIGAFGYEAGLFEYFADARDRFLKPSGVTIPSVVHLWAAPVEQDELRAAVDFWNRPIHALDMRAARQIAVNSDYSVRLSASDVLGAPAHLLSADPATSVAGTIPMRASSTCSRDGELHGIGGWFSAELSPGVTMSTSPLDSSRIDRRNIFLPIEAPVPVVAGDCVDIGVKLNPYEKVLTWDVAVRGAGAGAEPKASFSHSTWLGLPLGPDDLRRTSPSYVPRLTTRGQAQRTVLELINDRTALADVESAVLRDHPQLFRSRRDAEVFVADTVARYAT